MKAKEVKKILNISAPTLSRYVKIGLIRANKINPYHYEYLEEDVYKMIGIKKEKKNKINVSYSRVSTSKQKDQLKEQTNRIYNFCISKAIGLDKQYEDIGSGMNFERKSFLSVVEETIKGNVELVIIENRDRIVRFGFELLENIFKYFGTKIFVINDELQNKQYEQELTEDLVSIIHYFSMKMYSHRRKLNRIKKELLEEDNDNN